MFVLMTCAIYEIMHSIEWNLAFNLICFISYLVIQYRSDSCYTSLVGTCRNIV